MMMSRDTRAGAVKAKKAGGVASAKAEKKSKLTQLEEYIKSRDYAGALALLEFNRKSGDLEEPALSMWIGYCAFHRGDYSKAYEAYDYVVQQSGGSSSSASESKAESKMEELSSAVGALDVPPEVHLYMGCCLYYMQAYDQVEEAVDKYTKLDEAAQKAALREATSAASIAQARSDAKTTSGKPESDDDMRERIGKEQTQEWTTKGAPMVSLRNRLLFHSAHKLDDQEKLMMRHQDLSEQNHDQLSLAAIHYLRSHFQEATDIYKRLLLENRDDLALNVYVAMCYYKLDYYDVSLELLAVYLQAHPDSAIAVNLKACNHFRLYNGKAAEGELKVLSDLGHNLAANDLIRHNQVVFANGDGALQVLPQLVEFIPEARLNLVIYYLRHESMQEAYELIKDLEPTTPQEYILKGVVNASVGQALGSREHIKMAQQFFQLVGASATECDTIPGRQCMAACFFLLKQFEDVNIYLNSIKAYMYNDDDFNWNHCISLCQTGNYAGAEEAMLLVTKESYKQEYCYISYLSRCYIMNGKPRDAWELYLKMDTSNESFNLLQLIANDCYRMGQFLYAAKAFDVLEKSDPDPEYWEGKRGACVGVFQQVIANKGSKEDLRAVLDMIRNTNNPQVEYMVRVITTYCSDNGISVN